MSVKKLYPVSLWISVRLGFHFFVMILPWLHGIEGSEKPGNVELHCIVNKYQVLTCVWNKQSDVNDNYTLYYWYSDKEYTAAQCPHYLIVNQTTFGCQLSEIETFSTFTVKLTSNKQEYLPMRKFDKLIDLVKMDPPSKLQVTNTSSLELRLQWEQSYGSLRSHCMTYQVQYKNMASDKWTVKNASSTLFILPSYDPKQTYTFQVRSKLSKFCANSKFWSDWSQAVSWGRNITVTDEQPSTFIKASVILIVTFLLLIVVVLVIRTDRVWVVLVPQIPNPAKKFETLFTVHGNNFQEWLGISKEAVENLKTNYTERLCIVTEDNDCPGPDGKNPTTNLPTQ
ncbi:cytokine receptor common subunit gamma [Engystomops pustulosus]|uniref:cytokine receptor common subunit gamma n=1 Tax=Engystomops pustulosus TaxID=76066 RepID=UPI003AFA9DF7